MAGSDESTANKHAFDEDGHEDPENHDDSHQGSSRKRQRVRLSCLECRRRKLSCSRELPCDRCVKSGTPERCTYESKPSAVATHSILSAGKNSFAPPENAAVSFGQESRRSTGNTPPVTTTVLKDAARDHERIRKLELEVAQLRNALSKQSSMDGTTIVASPSTTKDASKDTPPGLNIHAFIEGGGCEAKNRKKAATFKNRYFGPHNVWSSLKELSGISCFMKETADEWLKPLNIHKKDRAKRKEDRERKFAEPDLTLETLLPSKAETDTLIGVYLDQFEQLYRILHVPTFKKEYETFWDPAQTRTASFTTLVLSMISVSCCLDMQSSNRFVGVKSSAFQLVENWVLACDTWLNKQSYKHRRLIHYQIMCLLYLAKRVNVIKKKRFWTEAGDLVRIAMTVGLHQDPDTMSPDISPYNKEMRRRIWSTMVEFDIQASFDIGAPTLLSQIHNDTDAPRNIDDDTFDMESLELPMSRPRTEYTDSSYAHFSRQSLPLRLELNKILTGPPIDLEWDQILQYSDMITKEIDALPAWDTDVDQGAGDHHRPQLAQTLLHLQLRQYQIPLHQPFVKLRKSHSRYQTAELIYYTASRDIVLMHDHLCKQGIRALYFLREDSINATVNLCNVALHQPRGSTSLINASHKETLRLIEKCIALKEDKILRCGNHDAWGYSSLCASYGMLEIHLGVKTQEAAKAAAAERFIALHYKLLSHQVPLGGQQQPQADMPNLAPDQITGAQSSSSYATSTPTAAAQLGSAPLPRVGLPLSLPWLQPQPDASQLMVPNPDLNFDLLGSDLNELWGDFTGTDFF
ncbi:hypothetical protein F5Y18DRAFT_397872 [Xylariaceae sp. FL1019]|nr:hypothetical protein F5Y18DRAFT_397872 [Xylariaceae sp. FL1019]